MDIKITKIRNGYLVQHGPSYPVFCATHGEVLEEVSKALKAK